MNNVEYCISQYFVGMKVEVGIPLPNSQTFRDWAVINEIDEDLVSLQLSRDILPDGVNLRIGQLLTVRGERDGQTHTCRCYIVSMGYDNDLLLRLTSEIFSGEMREFYRVDAFLPIKYQSPPDQTLEAVKSLWEARRKWRLNEMRVREQRRLEAKRERQLQEERAKELTLLDGTFSGNTVDFLQSNWRDEVQDDLYDELVVSAEPLAVTISGGGLKIQAHRKFAMDELVLMEIFVPSSRLIVDVVARVVFLGRNDTAEEAPCFNAGMQFVYIDESARFAINSHISSLQLRRIRNFKGFADVEPLQRDDLTDSNKHYAYIDGVAAVSHTIHPARIDKRLVFQQIALGLLLVCVIGLAGFYFSGYMVEHPKNDIQKFFEKGINQGRSLGTTGKRSVSGG